MGKFGCLSLFLSLFVVFLLAEEVDPPYRLQIGDRLHIAIYGDEKMTKREVVVDPTGEISYLYLNGISVLGMTLDQLRLGLQHELKNYFRDPILSVTAVEFAGQAYTIIGEVNDPGKKIIRGNPTVLTALCEAGGISCENYRDIPTEQADLKHSFLSRNGEYIPVDFERLVRKGDTDQDVPLRAGDYLFIATLVPSQVYVLGEVFAPSTINSLNPITLAMAISEVGGVTPIASSRIAVIRGSLCSPREYLIDYNRIVKGRACDFPLEDGDIVYVPAMRFTTLKAIVEAAIATFVGTIASDAGTNAFIDVVPSAAGTNIVQPVPILNVGVGSQNFTSPAQPQPPISIGN